jgi:hypothetical protein
MFEQFRRSVEHARANSDVARTGFRGHLFLDILAVIGVLGSLWLLPQTAQALEDEPEGLNRGMVECNGEAIVAVGRFTFGDLSWIDFRAKWNPDKEAWSGKAIWHITADGAPEVYPLIDAVHLPDCSAILIYKAAETPRERKVLIATIDRDGNTSAGFQVILTDTGSGGFTDGGADSPG